ncbi:uncharacterized protein [Coffea arabica]|uniref:Uncharacterized protein isoform X1 n=1 Tax=Coffea arabica TaxID=13443 RepID=A0ABM4VIV7_COFAR
MQLPGYPQATPMATITSLSPLKLSLYKPNQTSAKSDLFARETTKISRPFNNNITPSKKCRATLVRSAGLALSLTTLVGVGSSIAFAAEAPSLVGFSLPLAEPSNALSLPTWAVHVSSVVEWITAMALVWQYGEKSGNESWKGLSWGMVPLLGGAFCACTWHFFYNAESLEVLVAIQAALTVIGNVTIFIAAFRIFKSSEESSKNL